MPFLNANYNGRKVRFEILPFRTVLPETAGLYRFVYRSGTNAEGRGTWTTVYAGRSTNLNERVGAGINSHDEYQNARAAGATHIAVAEVPVRLAELSILEETMISTLKPKLNKMLKG